MIETGARSAEVDAESEDPPGEVDRWWEPIAPAPSRRPASDFHVDEDGPVACCHMVV